MVCCTDSTAQKDRTGELPLISGWWFGTFGLFFQILGIIIPTDFHIFRGVETTNQIS